MPDPKINSPTAYDKAPDKDPEQELEHPAPMPREQQGKGGRGPDRDPAGRQGGYHEAEGVGKDDR
ncbi:MAG TPA: hypothetical protein VG501_06560 [Rhizomicrobium sp.]|nr:hypothetical protein [Rhizomicrobium sp.]